MLNYFSNAPLVPTYNDQRTTVFITCVDNNAARRAVAKMCETWSIWWLDAGNLKSSGQISVGRSLESDELCPLRFPSRTTWLPLPSLQFPEILTKQEEAATVPDYSKLSCADMALADQQGLNINHTIASCAAALLMKMLVTEDLQYHCAHVSTEFGTSFTYNSPRAIKKYLREKMHAAALDTEDDVDYPQDAE